MKKSGFTMIELIFVIVILGILAAVAIPKLAATRTDAKVSTGAQEVTTFINELGTFYTAQGTFSGKDLADITNIKSLAEDDNSLANGDTADYEIGADTDCVTFTFDDVADGNVTVSLKASPTSSECKALKNMLAAKDINKTYHFGGSNISY